MVSNEFYVARVPYSCDSTFHVSRSEKSEQEISLWRDAHLARSKFTAENFSAADIARSESGELSRDGHRPSRVVK